MRIAMLSYHSSPLAALGGKHTGGMNVYVRQLSRHLAAQGHQVDIYTRGEDFQETVLITEGRGCARLLALPAGPARPLARDELVAHIPEFTENLLKYAGGKGLTYDLVHAHYWMSGLVGIQLKTQRDRPLVTMFHTLGLVKNRIEALSERESDDRIRGERRVLASTDMVVAATPAEQADLQWLYEVRGSQIVIIPPGVDLAHFRPQPQDAARTRLSMPLNTPVVFYVGRIEPLKGIDILVRAVHQLPAASQPDVYVIGGEANVPDQQLEGEMARLQLLAAELDLADRVHFLGKQDQEALPDFYAAADIVVVPSYYESFGMVALEAMACGRPVIASRVGGLAYVVQDGVSGYHVQEGNPQALATRLQELLTNAELRARLGQGGQQVAQEYGWKEIADRIEALYMDILKKY